MQVRICTQKKREKKPYEKGKKKNQQYDAEKGRIMGCVHDKKKCMKV